MNDPVRERVVLPLAIPLGALGLIFVLTFGFSRILLAVPPEVATAVAIMAAISVLSVFAVLALRPRLTGTQFLVMIAVAAVPFVLGGAVAGGVVAISTDGEGHEDENGEQAPPFVVEVAAENIEFDTDNITVPAGRDVEIVFENIDTVQHNVAIYTAEGGDDLFVGEIFGGPRTVTYDAGPIEVGTYYFQCDVHPFMNGAFVVEEAEEPAEEPEALALSISAENIQFDTDVLEVPADMPFRIVFENRDRDQHNVAIYTEQGGEALFRGEIFGGPEEKTYTVDPLEAGTYYFHCDVHPNMNGTVRVGS